MQDPGLAGIRRGKTTITTVSNPKAPCPLGKVNREFRVSRPNALWVVDFTYVHTWTGFVYVAFVIDAFARRIVGWKVGTSATAGFVLDALERAIHARRPGPEDALIHHSERGVLYLAMSYTQRLAEAELVPSVGSVGDSYDNALAQTINGLYKAGVIWRQRSWPNASAVEMATLRWVDWFNNQRLFGPIGHIPPRPKPSTMQPSTTSIWLHDSNETASGKPGTLQTNQRELATRCPISRCRSSQPSSGIRPASERAPRQPSTSVARSWRPGPNCSPKSSRACCGRGSARRASVSDQYPGLVAVCRDVRQHRVRVFRVALADASPAGGCGGAGRLPVADLRWIERGRGDLGASQNETPSLHEAAKISAITMICGRRNGKPPSVGKLISREKEGCQPINPC